MNTKMELKDFIRNLKHNKRQLTLQQYRTIKGQALSGDIDGAKKGLCKIIKRRHLDG